LPDVLFPALNCVGAAFGKPIAAQTASVGVSTTQVPREGNIIRDNLAWTFASLGYVLLVAVLFALFVPYVMGQVTTPFTDRDVAPTMGRSGGSGRDREGDGRGTSTQASARPVRPDHAADRGGCRLALPRPGGDRPAATHRPLMQVTDSRCST